MSSIDPKILGKIKKCLALSSSPNANEAATALRQAHALMAKHGVSSHTITMDEIGESKSPIRTMSRDKPAHWEIALASLVGKAFGCHLMVDRTVLRQGLRGHLNEGDYIFVGLKHQAEIAAYTASVLSRKCKTARQAWLKDTFGSNGAPRLGKKAGKTRMGDMFAEGWVSSISRLVHEFANTPEVEAAIAKHVEESTSGNEPPIRNIDKDKIGSAEYAAVVFGARAAQDVQLHRPMSGKEMQQSICMS